jgi:site-specific DNA-methyltransferase (adenine-specific)
MRHLARGKFATNIWRVPSLKGSSKEKCGHPSQKPIKLIERIVLSSSDPGDLVLDPFLGSGTTAVVAEKHHRRWLGIEIDPRYVALAGTRVQNNEDALLKHADRCGQALSSNRQLNTRGKR